jgi:hypothetical protein
MYGIFIYVLVMAPELNPQRSAAHPRVAHGMRSRCGFSGYNTESLIVGKAFDE